ncbi:hypothetical protein RHGRI_007075 [Rhododendron griersonianum]|uniref:Uncharacterized protein n=1 Tax=Rhododendron griersonianum TaxID=479676 RepID=A0AAV6KWL9_9ERIC|nr:hypothetical protein RHGRI_007075 [Rhododendron griersonianum]
MDIPIMGIKCNQEQGDKKCAFDCIPIKELNTLKEPSSVFANGSWVFPSCDIPQIIRCDNPTVINGFSFQYGKVTEDGNWVFYGGAWDGYFLVVASYTNMNKCTKLMGKINLRYKADADNRRHAKLLQAKLEDEFSQAWENDAGQYFNYSKNIRILFYYFKISNLVGKFYFSQDCLELSSFPNLF